MRTKRLFEQYWLTDGGLETTLIYHYHIDLPHFAAFELLNKPHYQLLLQSYYRQYLDLARKYSTGFILESATWRANLDWGYKMGYSPSELIDVNYMSIWQLRKLQWAYKDTVQDTLISGCIGPRSDGYQVGLTMNVQEAEEYHALQVHAFKQANADLITAMTINYTEEGLGIAKAAKAWNVPVVISFTVETDGHLPSGESLKEAIYRIDTETGAYPLYYMINCAHPSHFYRQMEGGGSWLLRLGGVRANASCRSHAELDEATELDPGNHAELAEWYGKLRQQCPNLRAFGGCCGTDASHLALISETLFGNDRKASCSPLRLIG
ncbi:homocysteine S-methyltransferase family protein [Flavilitoribacter nigricans]|uniref:Homocysteine S-methyltransferase n=1 Tax=Flavilitoribacter nigricans (strain ATCC 23147 / DSM 23189 / NBRC 102662 / NCIMB 1420 / SS-2) TaxID=1122177 RepID=A0A2D0MXN0_FLAN2|nr:homocysteine S-methyltransferase family protein [Flavilitoribacter nigricans]PHN01032.1 homocysteine S-methyltransferase [Flavilitoribacter nigricans DSM 23189 = NBRC 102662]